MAFARITPAAAHAAHVAMEYILSLDANITWKLIKATIDFRLKIPIFTNNPHILWGLLFIHSPKIVL